MLRGQCFRSLLSAGMVDASAPASSSSRFAESSSEVPFIQGHTEFAEAVRNVVDNAPGGGRIIRSRVT